MNGKDSLLLLAFLFLFTKSFTQVSDPLLINSQEIKANRYENIIGEPYLFEENVLMDIISRNGTLYKNLIGNYNGYEQVLEIYNGERHIKLHNNHYTAAKFYSSDSTLNHLILIKGAHPKFPDKNIIQLYRGSKYSLMMEYRFEVDQKKITNYGKSIVLKEFEFTPIYYLQNNNDWFRIKLSEKSIFRKIDDRKKGFDLLKAKQYNLSLESDVVKFFKDLENINTH